jgi:hypothetical protein
MHCRDAGIRSSRRNLTMSAIIVVKSSKSPKVLKIITYTTSTSRLRNS